MIHHRIFIVLSVLFSIIGVSSLNAQQMSAIDLKNHYANNEVRADQYFKGRRVEVKGKINKIRKDFLNNIVVELDTNTSGFQDVRCYMKKESAQEAANKNQGTMVGITGIGGGMIIGSPIINDCEFMQIEKATTKKGKK